MWRDMSSGKHLSIAQVQKQDLCYVQQGASRQADRTDQTMCCNHLYLSVFLIPLVTYYIHLLIRVQAVRLLSCVPRHIVFLHMMNIQEGWVCMYWLMYCNYIQYVRDQQWICINHKKTSPPGTTQIVDTEYVQQQKQQTSTPSLPHFLLLPI